MDEFKQILSTDPENFQALYSMALYFQNEKNYAGCFAMVERAIASYESKPFTEWQSFYFELKRLHSHLIRHHLDDIVGPAFHLLDPRWIPVFKLGRPREMAWHVTNQNIHCIPAALSAPQLRKLRYLSISIHDDPDSTLSMLMRSPLSMVRTLSLHLYCMPAFSTLRSFFTNARSELQNITSFSLKMPRIDDVTAALVPCAFTSLTSLTLASQTRAITSAFCEMLADSPQSRILTRLALIGTNLGNEGFFALFSSENFTSLQFLDLHDGQLSNPAAKVISSGICPPNLRTIDLRYNMLDPAGINLLRNTPIECICTNQHEHP